MLTAPTVAATFTHSASGADYGSVVIDSVTATESDNDTPGVTVNPEALPVAEGSTASYTVALTTQPTADVTVSLSRSGDSDLTVLDDGPDLHHGELEHGADGDGDGGG